MSQEGTRFGRYQLEELLGEGAMARVYKAYDPATDCHVALKILKEAWRADREVVGRFLSEARAAGALRHPNIVGIRDAGEIEAVPYIVMELVDGPSLAQLIRERGRLPVPTAVRIVRQLAQALDYAHGRGRVHRDVKPSNVLLEQGTHDARLTDFGIAIIDQPEATRVTRHGELIGTPRYMSPEQVRGERVDGRSDLFSLGVTLYEMLTGAHAFAAETAVALGIQITQSEPVPLRSAAPEVPPSVVDIVGKLLAKDPKDRYQTGAELVRALEAVEREAQDASWPLPKHRNAERGAALGRTGGPGPRRWSAYVAGLLLLVALGGLGYWLFGPRPPLSRPPIAQPDSATTRADQPAAVAPLANDESADGQPLRLVKARLVTAGGAVRVEGELVIYDPAGAFPGLREGETASAEIAYTVEDAGGRRAEGRIDVTVAGTVAVPPLPQVPTPPSRPAPEPGPVAVEDRVTVRAGGLRPIDATANDYDPASGAPVTLESAELLTPNAGTIAVNNNRIFYQPGDELDLLGPDETAEVVIAYTIRNVAGARAEGRVVVTVQGRLRVVQPAPLPEGVRPVPPPGPATPIPAPAPETMAVPVPPAVPLPSPIPPMTEPPTPVPAALPAPALGSWVELAQHVMRMPCSWLEREPGGGDLRLHGVTGTAAQKAELEALARGLDGVGGLALEVVPAGSPLCRAIDMAGATAVPNPVRMVRLAPPADGGCATPGPDGCYQMLPAYRLREGERLVLEVTTPDFPSHIVVDYLMADGNVAHLWPSPGLADRRVPVEGYARVQPPGGQVWVGDRRAGPIYLNYPVAAPFGRELIMVVASPAPLFTAARPAVEPAAAYVDALGSVLRQAGPTKRPRVSLMPIETVPGG